MKSDQKSEAENRPKSTPNLPKSIKNQPTIYQNSQNPIKKEASRHPSGRTFPLEKKDREKKGATTEIGGKKRPRKKGLQKLV